jgi:putative ABC transport system permease protein
MKLTHISLGNLRRRKGKTFLLVSGLTIGVAMVVAMMGITFKMQADVERKLDEYGANIVITPKTENLNLSYGGVSVTDTSFDVEELNASDAKAIETIENRANVSAIAPKVIGAYHEEDRSFLIVGVDFPAEFKIKKWWQLEGVTSHIPGLTESPAKGPHDIVLGSEAARSLGKRTGDKLTIAGTEYNVSGVLVDNTSQDDFAVFMAIDEAQRILGKKGRISMIEVSALCSKCPIDAIVAQISAKIPNAKVSAVRQAMTLKMQTVEQVVRFSIAVSIVVLAIGSLIVFVSMLSSVNERTKEIGVLRAIGFRQSHIVRVILFEALVVSIISGLTGWLIGSLSVSFLAPQLMNIEGFSFDPAMLGAATAVALVIGMISSLYPAMKASRLDPSEALRYI